VLGLLVTYVLGRGQGRSMESNVVLGLLGSVLAVLPLRGVLVPQELQGTLTRTDLILAMGVPVLLIPLLYRHAMAHLGEGAKSSGESVLTDKSAIPVQPATEARSARSQRRWAGPLLILLAALLVALGIRRNSSKA
jgi:hypothetical protein